MEEFEDELMSLIDRHRDSMTRDEIISVFELRIMALKEEADDDEDADDGEEDADA